MAIKLNKVEPDYATAPGETLREVIKSRGYTQADIASRLGISAKHLSNIINGKNNVTPEVATKLEYVLEISASFWNNLTANYETYLESKKHDDKMNNQLEWVDHFNYSELAKNNFVPKTRDKKEKLKNLLKFFRYPDIELMKSGMDNDNLLAGAFRISTKSGEIDKFALKAWIQQGDIEAEQIKTAKFSQKLALESVQELRELIIETDPDVFIPQLQNKASKFGVAVIFVPEVKGSRVSGLTRWLTPYPKAIIQLSLRYKTNDILWFTFFHELAHIILHNRQPYFTLVSNYETSKEEKVADKWAANVLIPEVKWQGFISYGDFSESGIKTFSKNIKTHPGIVVGRLQKEGRIPYTSRLGKLKIHYAWNK